MRTDWTAARVRALREAFCLSQAEFATLVGVAHRNTVGHWEAGRRIPTGPRLVALDTLERVAAQARG